MPVPYEYILHHEVEKYGRLPFDGGLLEQPHLLLMCFRLIDEEMALTRAEQRKLAEINRQQREMWEKN